MRRLKSRTRTILILAAATMGLAATSAGPATAAPSGPIGIGPISGAIYPEGLGVLTQPRIVMSANGEATTVWQRHDISNSQWAIEYTQIDSHLVADFSTIPVAFVSQGDVQPDPPGLAAGPNGSAVVAQHFYNGSHWLIRLARINSDGSISAPKILSSTTKDSMTPLVALDSKGKGIVSWLTDETGTGGWVLHWCTYSAAGATGAVQSANTKTTTIAGAPSLSISPAGVATLAFRLRNVAKSQYSVQAVRISSLGKVTKTVTVSTAATGLLTDISQATAANGMTAIAWVAPNAGASGSYVKVGMLNSANTLKTSSAIVGAWAGTQAKPKVAVGVTGAAAVVWQEEGPEVSQIYALRVSTTGSLSTRRLLTAASYEAFDPAISCGADGSAIVSWTRYPADLSGPPTNQFVRYGTRGGFSGFTAMNSPDDETGGVTANAAAPNGRAVILSQLEGPSGSSITAWSDL